MNLLNMHDGECLPLTAPCVLCKARTAIQTRLDVVELNVLEYLVTAQEIAELEDARSTRRRAVRRAQKPARRKKTVRRKPGARRSKSNASFDGLKLTERTRAMLASNRVTTLDQLASLSEDAFYELKGADGRHRRNVVKALEKAGLPHKG